MKRLVFNYAALFLFAALALNCTKKPMPSETSSPLDSAIGLRYLALGDSYTIGQNVNANERFPFLTTSLLHTHHINVATPRYIATTGWTTANLLAAINEAGNLGTFDIVSLLIGVNDQYQGEDTTSYRARFTELLEKSIALAGNRKHRVFVLSIPDYSATPFVGNATKPRIHQEIEVFNAINKEVTAQYGISYTDITPLTREAAIDASLLASDRLHYSGKEHQKWADLLAPEIKKALQ